MTDKKKIKLIIIDEALCKGCSICVEICGRHVFTISDQINQQGYYVPVPTNLSECTGCLLCELICPELAVILVQNAEVET